MILILTILWICRRMVQRRVNVAFRKLQLLSASAMAFTHGQNDAQKAMGVICLALIMYGKLAVVPGHQVNVPLWVKFGCACMMAFGTASGGWRIIRTMGHRIVKLRPIHGFAAETASALVLFTTAHFGIPVSTTHSITGAIMGVGASMNALRGALGGGREHRRRLAPDHPLQLRHRRADAQADPPALPLKRRQVPATG